jgi:hypothetical protein
MFPSDQDNAGRPRSPRLHDAAYVEARTNEIIGIAASDERSEAWFTRGANDHVARHRAAGHPGQRGPGRSSRSAADSAVNCAMDFEILGDIEQIETIAAGSEIERG